MDASPTAGDGNKMDMLINLLSNMNEKMEKLDERVKELEMENDESTIALKSESSEKEKQEMNLISLGFLLPEETGKYKYEKSIEKLSDSVVQNMNKLFTNVGKNFYKIKKYLIELFSLHGCEYIYNDKPSPISIDHIIKEHNAAEDEEEKEEIVNAFEKDLDGIVKWRGAIVLSRADHHDFIQKKKTIKGILNNVSIEHEKIGRIMQDGGSALDEGDLVRVYNALNNHYATRTATTRITLMIKLLTIVLEAVSVGERIDLIKTIDKIIETKKELEDQGAKFDELLYISI